MIQELVGLHPNVKVFIKREDLIHPYISGNKYRKLKYNLIEAKCQGAKTLLSFGGAYSNHIAALAFAGKEHGFETIGVIRGEELVSGVATNPTLSFAASCGMKFHFVTRSAFRCKTEDEFMVQLRKQFGDFYLVPEGGTNHLAIKGCEEILTPEDVQFDFICLAVGTGGTISGIANSAQQNQTILGFPALKESFLEKDICKFAVKNNWQLIRDYHFGGYAKVTDELIQFINDFYDTYGIPLDPIYTGKMVFGVVDKIQKGFFPAGSTLLLVHTGGLQGIKGMNEKRKTKNLNTIHFEV